MVNLRISKFSKIILISGNFFLIELTSILPKRIKDDKAKNMGRKKKDGQEKGEHTKFAEDNIIRKIKSNFIIGCIRFIAK